MRCMQDEERIRRHIAGEVRAEVARQGKPAAWGADVLHKSRQNFSEQWRGKRDYLPRELVALADGLGVDVRQFLPPGYVLMVVTPGEPMAVAS